MEEEIIFAYTKAEAIEDGILFEAGRLGNRGIVLTTHLLEELSKEDLLTALVQGLERARRFTGPDRAGYTVNGRRVWVDDNGADFTFMFPEDD
jgi:hypothetical protein